MSAPGATIGTMAHPWDYWHQPILNAHPVPERFTDARGRYPRVRARIVWRDDGEETIDTEAWAWTRELVLVAVPDKRSQFAGVWVPVGDVRRIG